MPVILLKAPRLYGLGPVLTPYSSKQIDAAGNSSFKIPLVGKKEKYSMISCSVFILTSWLLALQKYFLQATAFGIIIIPNMYLVSML